MQGSLHATECNIKNKPPLHHYEYYHKRVKLFARLEVAAQMV